jgi:hypothetical protein
MFAAEKTRVTMDEEQDVLDKCSASVPARRVDTDDDVTVDDEEERDSEATGLEMQKAAKDKAEQDKAAKEKMRQLKQHNLQMRRACVYWRDGLVGIYRGTPCTEAGLATRSMAANATKTANVVLDLLDGSLLGAAAEEEDKEEDVGAARGTWVFVRQAPEGGHERRASVAEARAAEAAVAADAVVASAKKRKFVVRDNHDHA